MEQSFYMQNCLHFEKVKIMKQSVYEGRVIELTEKDLRMYKLKREGFLAIDARAREPKKPHMYYLIDSLFREFLGKMVKITVEEVKA